MQNNKTLRLGIDGDCIYVGLGELHSGKYVFAKIENGEKAKSNRQQAVDLYFNVWTKQFPEEGLLGFDFVDGLERCC